MATLIINKGTSKAFSLEPAIEGITESKEKIWSSNTGRVSTGEMTGDIIAKKLKLSVKYPPMSKAEKDALEKAVGDAFFKVEYDGKDYTMYAGTPTFSGYADVKGVPRYKDGTVDLIEK